MFIVFCENFDEKNEIRKNEICKQVYFIIIYYTNVKICNMEYMDITEYYKLYNKKKLIYLIIFII